MQVWDWAAIAASFLVIAWFAWFMLQGDPERGDEDAARDFFDQHGHWPDESGPPPRPEA